MSEKKYNNVGVVILAAGKGTRMKSDLPKVMHLLNGRPLIDHVVKSVENSNCQNKPVVVVSKEHTLVQDYLGNRADYAIQVEQLGTGHAVRSAEDLLKGKVDHVLVLYGDMPFISSYSIDKLIEKHLNSGMAMTILTATTPDFNDWRTVFKTFGRILRDGNNKIKGVVEWKDASEEQLKIKELSTCYFCFKADWLWENLNKLKNNNKQGEYYLPDLIPLVIEQGKEITSTDIDLREVVGVNAKEDLEMAENIK